MTRGARPASHRPHKPVAKTTVYYRPDHQHLNHSDAGCLAKTYFNNDTVAQLPATLPGAVSSQAQDVVLIGNDYASNC